MDENLTLPSSNSTIMPIHTVTVTITKKDIAVGEKGVVLLKPNDKGVLSVPTEHMSGLSIVPMQEEVDRLRAPILKGRRDGLRTNPFWMTILSRAQSDATHLPMMRAADDFYANFGPKELTPLAKQYLGRDKASIPVPSKLSQRTLICEPSGNWPSSNVACKTPSKPSLCRIEGSTGVKPNRRRPYTVGRHPRCFS